jgi:Xaa-Pro dipeptidase
LSSRPRKEGHRHLPVGNIFESRCEPSGVEMAAASPEGDALTIFSPSEIERRWDKLWATATSVDSVVTCSFHNSYYLSGFPMNPWGRYAITVLFRNADPVLIVPELEEEAARSESPIRDCRTYNDDDGPSIVAAGKMLVNLLRSRRARVIGVDAESFPSALYEQLRTASSASLRDIGEQIDDVRLVSSDEELMLIREAIRVADFGMERVVSAVRPGADEAELATEISHAMVREAMLDTDCSTVCVIQQGERQSSRCHRQSSSLPIGDRQTLQVWCESYVWHYCGNVERCLIIGDAPPDVRRACNVALEAFEVASEAVRPGATFSDVHLAARKVLMGAGYTNIPTGSGLVRGLLSGWSGRIEGGNLRSHNGRELRPGMVISVEPWAVISGVGAPHLATTLLVTDDGHEVLNRFPSTVPVIE